MPDQSKPFTRERFESEFRVALHEQSAKISNSHERENTYSAAWRLFKAASDVCFGSRSRLSPMMASDITKAKAYLNGPDMAVARSKASRVFTLLNETFLHGEQKLEWRSATRSAPSTAKENLAAEPMAAAEREYASWLVILGEQQEAERHRRDAGEREYASWGQTGAGLPRHQEHTSSEQPNAAPSLAGTPLSSRVNASAKQSPRNALHSAKQAYINAWTKIHALGTLHEIRDAPLLLTGSYSSCPWLQLSKENFEDRLQKARQTSRHLHILDTELEATFKGVEAAFHAYHALQDSLKGLAKSA